MKSYLGDGCYAELDGGAIKLTAEDGIRATDMIWLEPETLDALIRFAEVARAASRTSGTGQEEKIK